MKRLLSICLLVAVIIGSSSFTTNSERNLKQNPFIRVAVTINQTYPINNTNCVAVIHISLAFDWNPLTGGVSNVYVNAPTITVNCGFARIVALKVAALNFDPYSHVSTLEFLQTTDADANTVISDTNVISDLKSKLNDEIDYQKP